MTAQDALFEWLSDRPLWQQDLARRLVDQTELTDGALDDILGSVLASVRGGADTELQMLRRDELPAKTATPAARLASVGSLSGVAAAVHDQTIEILPEGLTIVYGANGTGKSTYVRVLKRILRTVDRDDVVRGDVYVDSVSGSIEAAASFGILRDGELEEHRVDLHEPADLGLQTISVFDTGSAELYLNHRNQIAYVPMAVRLLARMAATQDELRSQLASMKSQALEQEPNIHGVAEDTETRARLDSLDHTTDLDELATFSSLGHDEIGRLRDLRAAVASSETEDVRADARSAAQDAEDAEEMVEEISALVEAISEERLAELRRAAHDARTASDRATQASEALEGLGTGIGGDTWRRMWAAARDFVEHEGHTFPPETGEPCPLCRRPTDQPATARLQTLEDHVSSQLEAEATEAAEELRRHLDRLEPDLVDGVRAVVERSLVKMEPELASQVDAILVTIESSMASIAADPAGTVTPAAVTLPLNALRAWRKQRQDHADLLQQSLDPTGQAELEHEVLELEARQVLGGQLDTIRSWVATLLRVRSIGAAHSDLATNSLTSMQRQLSESLVSDLLASTLESELSQLRCNHLPVDLDPRTAVGSTDVALQLAGAYGAPAPGEVLSEGEQRALALAFFLAEVGSAEHDGGIVLDDPVSSLDDARRAHIAQRLVTESRQRQVVVFTHDMPFMLELNELARSSGLPCETRGIWRHGSKVGRVDQAPPFTALRLRKRVSRLTQRAQEWDRPPEPADEDEAWTRVCDFYRDMRLCWEQAVEERLFKGVVQRFQREVKALKLGDVEITDELIEAIEQGMTRCSYFVHDAPAGTRTTIPDRSELEKDLEQLQTFETATR